MPDFMVAAFLVFAFCQLLQQYQAGMRTWLGFSHSLLLLEVKQSRLEENGRGLLQLLIQVKSLEQSRAFVQERERVPLSAALLLVFPK